MKTHDDEINKFLNNGGRINYLPPSTNTNPKKYFRYTNMELEQVINFVKINSNSSTYDIAKYLNIIFPKCEFLLLRAQQLGKIQSTIQHKKHYWKAVQS